MSEPLTHVIRPSLPWRVDTDAMTECGLRADSYPAVSRDEASARWKKLGAQRASLWLCQGVPEAGVQREGPMTSQRIPVTRHNPDGTAEGDQ